MPNALLALIFCWEARPLQMLILTTECRIVLHPRVDENAHSWLVLSARWIPLLISWLDFLA
jgi:hypothetical protein